MNLGEGLGILINCGFPVQHSWMAFSLCRSVEIYLPYAKVGLICNYKACDIYRWTKRYGVPLLVESNRKIVDYKKQFIGLKLMELLPHVVACREYDESLLGPVDAKSDIEATFVDYKNGCGNFSYNKALHVSATPFGIGTMLASVDMTINEVKVLQFWDSINRGLFTAIY
jgi:hypothetical protein